MYCSKRSPCVLFPTTSRRLVNLTNAASGIQTYRRNMKLLCILTVAFNVTALAVAADGMKTDELASQKSSSSVSMLQESPWFISQKVN